MGPDDEQKAAIEEAERIVREGRRRPVVCHGIERHPARRRQNIALNLYDNHYPALLAVPTFFLGGTGGVFADFAIFQGWQLEHFHGPFGTFLIDGLIVSVATYAIAKKLFG